MNEKRVNEKDEAVVAQGAPGVPWEHTLECYGGADGSHDPSVCKHPSLSEAAYSLITQRDQALAEVGRLRAARDAALALHRTKEHAVDPGGSDVYYCAECGSTDEECPTERALADNTRD